LTLAPENVRDTLPQHERTFITMANDITQMREIQIELQRSNEELDKFAYVASHDLKSPLRAIQNITSWVLEDCEGILPEDSAKDLVLLSERAGRMENLLDALLQYSRLGTRTAEVTEVDVNQLLTTLTTTLEVPPGFSIVIAEAEKMPVIEAPEAMLNLVFGNYLVNAIKHHDQAKGKIEIHYQLTDQGHEFTVKDDGPGIDPQFHEKIFQMFATLKSRDEVEGSGMGLAFVKKAIERHGGKVFVKSVAGQGTTMGFVWPELKS
jgi:hypothetical protein